MFLMTSAQTSSNPLIMLQKIKGPADRQISKRKPPTVVEIIIPTAPDTEKKPMTEPRCR